MKVPKQHLLLFICCLVARCTLGAVCDASIELVFALDESGSVGEDNYELAKDFMKAVVDGFTVSPNAVQVAVSTVRELLRDADRCPFVLLTHVFIFFTHTALRHRRHLLQFSTEAELNWGLNEYGNANDLKSNINDIEYNAGWTCTGKEMKLITEEIICSTCPGVRASSKKVVLFLTVSARDPLCCHVPPIDLTFSLTHSRTFPSFPFLSSLAGREPLAIAALQEPLGRPHRRDGGPQAHCGPNHPRRDRPWHRDRVSGIDFIRDARESALHYRGIQRTECDHPRLAARCMPDAAAN